MGIMLAKVRRNLRDYGLATTLRKAVLRVLGLIFEVRTYRIYRVILPASAPLPPPPPGISLRLLDPAQGSLIAQVEGMEEWLSGKVARMLEAGSICLAALEGDRVAGFNLISFDEVEMPLIAWRRRFPAGFAWSEQITVHPLYRGRGLAVTLRRTAFAILARRRCRRFYGGTLPGNAANLALCRKVGFRLITDIRHFKLLFLHRWSFHRVPRELGA